MKLIQPISIWDNGKILEAGVLNASGFGVDLKNSASFHYSLHEIKDGFVGGRLKEGNLHMSTEDYNLWEKDEFAWEWVASQLNLTIIGDYVPPTTTTTTTTIQE